MLESRPMNKWIWISVVAAAIVPMMATATGEVEITAEPSHHLVLQNKFVRVFKVEVAPGGATLLHSHRKDYVFVSLGSAGFSNEIEGKPAATVTMQDGEARFAQGGFVHRVRNLAKTPFRNVTVELLQRPDGRTKWDEERGLHILEGGTQDVMWVKDGVRVSEVELQPGGMTHKHSHFGPELIIALSDLTLHSNVHGRASAPVRLAAGEIQWLEGSATNGTMNMGKNQAKYLMLEFGGQ